MEYTDKLLQKYNTLLNMCIDLYKLNNDEVDAIIKTTLTSLKEQEQ